MGKKSNTKFVAGIFIVLILLLVVAIVVLINQKSKERGQTIGQTVYSAPSISCVGEGSVVKTGQLSRIHYDAFDNDAVGNLPNEKRLKSYEKYYIKTPGETKEINFFFSLIC